MWASWKGHVECVQLLLHRGAHANVRNNVSAVRDETSVLLSRSLL